MISDRLSKKSKSTPTGESLGVSMIPPLVFPAVNLYKKKDTISIENLFFFPMERGGPVMLMLLGLPIFALFFCSIWEASLSLSLLAILAMITWD